MKKVVQIILFSIGLLFFPLISLGVNTVTKIDIPSQASNHDWYSYWRMSFDEAGTKCVDTSTKQRVFVHIVKTGTVQYDIEGSIANPPSDESTQTFDLASNQSAGYSNVFTTLSPFTCIRVETCTGCTITATFELGGGR